LLLDVERDADPQCQVLSDYDPDAAAQEMIVEQFIATWRRINADG